MKYVFKTIPALCAAAALAVSAVSCSGTGSDNMDLTFRTYSGSGCFSLQGSAKTFGQDSDVVYSDSVSLLIPQKFGDENIAELVDSITSIALGETGVPMEQAINNWIQTSAKESGYTPVPTKRAAEDMAQGFDQVSGFVTALTPELMVYCIREDSYEPGAAHGMTSNRYLNYSITKGKLLTLGSLFTPQGLKQLPGVIAAQAKSDEASLGPTDIADLPANGNFYISADTEIVFAYQPYEVASFAQGQINVSFYPYELVDYMTPEAIAMFGLQDIR